MGSTDGKNDLWFYIMIGGMTTVLVLFCFYSKTMKTRRAMCMRYAYLVSKGLLTMLFGHLVFFCGNMLGMDIKFSEHVLFMGIALWYCAQLVLDLNKKLRKEQKKTDKKEERNRRRKTEQTTHSMAPPEPFTLLTASHEEDRPRKRLSENILDELRRNDLRTNG